MTYVDSATYTLAASTKRSPAAVAGQIGAPVTSIASLSILPLIPASPQIVERYKLESPRNVFTTAAQGNPDIREGDRLVIGAVEYDVKILVMLTGPVPHTRLIVELVK